jgi:hypothetical protein
VRVIVDLGKKQTLKSMCGKIPLLKDLPEIKALKVFEFINCYCVTARLVNLGFHIEPESIGLTERISAIVKKVLEEA